MLAGFSPWELEVEGLASMYNYTAMTRDDRGCPAPAEVEDAHPDYAVGDPPLFALVRSFVRAARQTAQKNLA